MSQIESSTISEINLSDNTEIPPLPNMFPLTTAFLMAYLIITGGRLHELFPILLHSPIPLGDLTGGGMIICFFIESRSRGLGKIALLKEEKYVLGLLMLGIITIPTSVWPGHSLDFLIGSYLKTLVFFFLMTRVLRQVKDLRKMVWAFMVSIFLIGLMSINAEITHYHAVTGMYDPNDIALVMVCSLPFVIYFFKNTHGLGKIFLAICFVLIVMTIIMSASRGGFVGLVATGGYFFLKSRKNMKAQLLVVAILVLIMFIHFAPDTYWDRISTIWNPQTECDETGGGRTEIWKKGLKIFLTHPILGVGIDNFTTAYGISLGTPGKWSAVHNSFLQIVVELGIVGLILFVFLTFGTVLKMRRLQKIWKDEKGFKDFIWLSHAIEVGMSGYIVSGFFLSQAYFDYLYFMLGLSVAMQKVAMHNILTLERTPVLTHP
ncbi:MAG: O-antigen ligase family protein [Thermodesulfobacteriota bacterium]|nr:O-antigen ligase family protein [Thermodesulfobacteriota bacterium]